MMTSNDRSASPGTAGITIRDLWQVFLKRKWIVIALTGALFAGMTVVSFLTTPAYTAKGQILIERESSILSFQDMFQVEPLSDDYYQTQYKLLQSRSLASDTIDRLKLTENKAFLASVLKKAVRPGVDPKTDPLLRRKLATWFLETLSVEPLRRTRLVNLSFTHRDPKTAADILNALIDSYIDMNIERKYQANAQATNFLASQIEAVRNDIMGKERNLQEYGQAKNIFTLTNTENTVVSTLNQLSEELTRAQLDRINKWTYYSVVKDAGPDNIPQAMNNAVMQRLTEEYNRYKSEFAKVSETYLPGMPLYQQTKAQLDSAKKNVEDETKAQIARAYTEYEAALQKEQATRNQFNEQKGQAFQQGSNAIQYNTLLNEITNLKSVLDTLMTRKSEADVSSRLKGLGASNIYVVDRAEIPLVPSSPRTARNMALGLMVGLFLGLGLALLTENLDVTIKDADDVRAYAGVPTLGIVPMFPHDGALAPAAAEGSAGERSAVIWSSIGQKRHDRRGPGAGTDLHVQFAPDSTFAEQFRTIRTALLYSVREKDVKAMIVTSPLPRDGKTSTACNLAASLAQAGKRVVIIDADLRKPRLHAIFRIKNLNGLTKYLMDSLPLSDLLRATPIPTLFVVNAGALPPDPSELLGSERMTALIAELKKSFDFVIVDTPPTLAVSDALVVGSRLDGAILVVRRGQTPREALRSMKDKLEAHKIKPLGVVINAVRMRDLDEYHVSSYYGDRKRSDG
ncbi:MAG TPA: polysaccharide biosynthesis tyrosine autokinase [Candidatus Bathyarchaeia archaeon]|nr:polysaccharide biosynthesis tyrosine autokinase [Candidatus Bathyarchaeia archaeon]